MSVANSGEDNDKTVTCSIIPDDEMAYLTREVTTDEYGVVHPKGIREQVDLITNPLATINRTIPMAMIEGSVTFIIDIARKHAATLDTIEEKKEFIFDILNMLNPRQTAELEDIYKTLSDSDRRRFIEDCISLNRDGTLRTDNGFYCRWEPFNDQWFLRDSIIAIYNKYPDIFTPYHIFVPKKKWGRDIYIGQDYIGYQYIMMLKQSGEKGFSVRSAGSISDESLPEKSHNNKTGRAPFSEKPIRFGEYELPNFMIIANPEDFALVSALYRCSIDGRRFLYEAILSEDGNYNIPDKFTSRTVEILQTYMKSLGIKMATIINEDEYIGEPEHITEEVEYIVGDRSIFCTVDEMYYLKKINVVYQQYLREYPNTIDDPDDVWDYILEHLPFKKKHLTDNIIKMFKDNIEAFGMVET